MQPHSGLGTQTPELFLARRAAAGQAEAWSELIERYGRKIFNIAYQFAGDMAEAEDLTQEIFLRLYTNLKQYRGDVPLSGWALRLSRNLCIDHYRRTRRERSATVISEEILEFQSSGDDLQGRSERREQLRLVYETLQEMSEDHATLILLRDLQGLAYDEICAFLELPDGTMKSRLRRARLDLMRRVDEKRHRFGEATPARSGGYAS